MIGFVYVEAPCQLRMTLRDRETSVDDQSTSFIPSSLFDLGVHVCVHVEAILTGCCQLRDTLEFSCHTQPPSISTRTAPHWETSARCCTTAHGAPPPDELLSVPPWPSPVLTMIAILDFVSYAHLDIAVT